MRLSLVVLSLCLLTPAAAQTVEERIQAVLPRPAEEAFLEVPWQPNVMRARVEAQRTGRPLAIWIMDGNVLGCT